MIEHVQSCFLLLWFYKIINVITYIVNVCMYILVVLATCKNDVGRKAIHNKHNQTCSCMHDRNVTGPTSADSTHLV